MSSKKENVFPFFSGAIPAILIVLAVFVSPLIFFTDLTRNPYIFQITLLNISMALLGFAWIANAKKALWIKGGNLIVLFLLFCLVFMLSSIFSYFSHPDFFKPSMRSEYLRVWLFTAINSFLPFFLSSQQDSFEGGDSRTGRWLFLFLFWGSLWFLFPFLKVENTSGSAAGSFFDFYGLLIWGFAFWFVFKIIKGSGVHSILHAVMAVCLFSSAYGILQYLGIEFIWAKLLTPYGRRAVSTFGNPNFASSYAVMVIPLSVYYLSCASSRMEKVFYSLVFIFSCAMIFASLTRSSLIGACAAIIFLFSFSEYRKSFLSGKTFKRMVLAVLLIFLIWPDESMKPASLGVARRFYEGAGAAFSKFTLELKKNEIYPSFHQRLLIWSCGWQMFSQNPALGKGWGGFELFYPYYQGQLLVNYPNLRELRTHANNGHNEIVEIASQTGLLGLGFYLLFFVVLFKRGFTYALTASEKDKKFALAIMAALAGMLADNMLNVTLHFAQPAFLFWWLAGTLNAKISQERAGISDKIFKPAALISAVFLLVSCWLFYSQLMREVYYFRGFKEMRKNLYAEAVKDLEKAYSYSSREVNNNYELANAYTRIGDYEKAEKYYVEALKSNAGYDEIFFNLGVVQSKAGKTAQAAENFKISILINPLNKTAYQGLMDLFMKDPAGNSKEALKILNTGIRMFPYEPAFYSMAGYFASMGGDEKTALGYYGMGLEKNPAEVSFYRYLKKNYGKLDERGRYSVGLAEKCAEIESLMQNTQKAMEAADKAVAYKDNYFLKYLRAKVFFAKGDFGRAEALLKEALEIREDFVDAIYGLASVYEKEGDIKSQISTLRLLLSYEPGNARASARLREAEAKI